MNRFETLFKQKPERVLNIYTTAGYPTLESTVATVIELTQAGADIIELGMPYSDPLADGTTIQKSSQVAIARGMTLEILFNQATAIRKNTDTPIILMGYLNQMMQYGTEAFLSQAQQSGIDGLIIPDLPMDIFVAEYEALFKRYDQAIAFLVTPETSDARIKEADRLSTAFLYVVSKSNITGGSSDLDDGQLAYFQRLDSMQLTTPRLIGFGIHDKATFDTACKYGHGAIIGSAFIRHIGKGGSAKEFVDKIIG